MVENDLSEVREELERRLDAMADAAADARELLRRLHSAKGLAQAYGLRGFADAAHGFEDEVIGGAAIGRIEPRVEALRRKLASG